ncbi:MAG: glycosyltransferase [Bacteroidota bacterium]
MSEYTKVLLLDSAYPVNVRNRKIIKTLDPVCEIRFCAWNRDGRTVKAEDAGAFMYTKISRYGARIKKVLNLIGFAWFIRKSIRHFKPGVIIASHWDMLVIASLFAPKGSRLIYENLDMPTASNELLRKLLVFFERMALKKTDAIIFASRFFEPEYRFFNGEKVVIENKPYKAEFAATGGNVNKANREPVITFLGTVRYADIMKRLIDAVKNLPAQLQVWGDGPDEALLRQYAQGIGNITFYGRYEYSRISSIYKQSDLVWAVYPSRDHNVKFAISNKYHECILFATPGVFAAGTKLGELVTSQGTGFTVDPYSTESIADLIKKINSDHHLLEQCANKLLLNSESRFWEDYDRLIKDVVLKSE